MPIYSIPLTDEQILKKVSDGKKIFIIGCSACANISCNIYRGKKEPAFNFFSGPVSMIKEISRIKTLISENNNQVNSMTIMGLCSYSERKGKKIINKMCDADTVIVMSCTGGLNTILSIVKDRTVIHGMRVKGFKSIQSKRKGINLSGLIG